MDFNKKIKERIDSGRSSSPPSAHSFIALSICEGCSHGPSTNTNLYAERCARSIAVPAFYKPQLLWSPVQRHSSLLGVNSFFQRDCTQLFRAVTEHRDVQRDNSSGMPWDDGESFCSSYDNQLTPWRCGTWCLASSAGQIPSWHCISYTCSKVEVPSTLIKQCCRSLNTCKARLSSFSHIFVSSPSINNSSSLPC